MRFDLFNLRLIVPVRLAAAILIPLVIAQLTDHVSWGVSAALGAFVCGVSDSGETFPIRARVMVVTSLSLAVTALIGGLVSESSTVIVLTSILVALTCGYVACFGPNASITGMLALVIFSIFAGGEVSDIAAAEQAVCVLLGGLLQTAFALAGWPFGRLSGIRGGIADVWRAISVLSSGAPKDMLNPVLPGQLAHAASGVALSGAQGASREWLQEMVSSAERLRLPLSTISAKREELMQEGREDCDEYLQLSAFTAAMSRFTREVARALVMTRRRSGIAPALEEVRRTAKDAAKWAPDQVAVMVAASESATSQFAGRLPIGRKANLRFSFSWGTHGLRAAASRNWSWSSPIARHAIRLAIATPVAWIVGFTLLDAHQYWVPLTVAWVTRPGYGITVGRVVSRTIGTLIGLALIGGTLVWLEPGPWGMIAICGVAGYLLFAFLPVNYALAVTFVTALVVTLLSLGGNALYTSMDDRALGTILGGVIALLASHVGASLAGPTLVDKLAAVAAAAKEYAQAVADDGDVRAAAAPLVDARRSATTAVEESMLEPRRGQLEPKRAERVLDALLIGVFYIAATTTGDSKKAFVAEVDLEGLEHDLDELGDRLHEIGRGNVDLRGTPIPGLPPPRKDEPGFDAARAAVQRSLAYLGS